MAQQQRLARLMARTFGAAAAAATAGSFALSTDPAVAPNPSLWTRNLATGDGAIFQAALGVDPTFARERLGNMILFAGRSNPSLAEEVCYELNLTQGRLDLGRFADGEVSVQVLDNVRGKDVYILQSTSQPVNENLVELLLLISTMRRASARSITAVIPYYGYKRDVGACERFLHLLLLR